MGAIDNRGITIATTSISQLETQSNNENNENSEISNSVNIEIAEVLGMNVSKQERYSLIFGEELAKHGVVYKSTDDESILDDKYSSITELTSIELGNSKTVEIMNNETVKEQLQNKIEEIKSLDKITKTAFDELQEKLKKEQAEKEAAERARQQKEREATSSDYYGGTAKIVREGQEEALLAIAEPDPNYTGKVIELSAENRALLERIVMGEAGGEGFIGASLVAQTFRDYMVYGGYTSVAKIIRDKGYTGSLSKTPNDVAKQAVQYIFDEGGCAVKHSIFYFYAWKWCKSSWHETQHFVVQYKGGRFFSKNK